jgi:hypothetical protein
MTVDFEKPVLLMPGGSYVVALANGYPYNVLANDPLMASVQAWLDAGNMAIPYVPPVAPVRDPQDVLIDKVAGAFFKLVKQSIQGTAGPAASWSAIDAALRTLLT